MEGLYLYCIRDKSAGPTPFSNKGIDGSGEVITLEYHGLEVVVSEIPLDEFDAEAIQVKAQEDLGWIKEKAVLHERVIEEAMTKDGLRPGLIPMGFGTIFKGEKSLTETLDKNRAKIMDLLNTIRGKQEWNIKVYLKDKKILAQEIKNKSGAIQKKEGEIASLPEGMAFFMEEELREIINREINSELTRMMNDIFEGFKGYAVDYSRNKILEKELTGKNMPMVLNAAFLVPAEQAEAFIREAESLGQRNQEMGLVLEYSGPWPAYNFTKL